MMSEPSSHIRVRQHRGMPIAVSSTIHTSPHSRASATARSLSIDFGPPAKCRASARSRSRLRIFGTGGAFWRRESRIHSSQFRRSRRARFSEIIILKQRYREHTPCRDPTFDPTLRVARRPPASPVQAKALAVRTARDIPSPEVAISRFQDR